MKKILVLGLIGSCITLHLLGDTKAFEGAVRAYCTKGKTPELAQQVLTIAPQKENAKDYKAANTFTKQYGCTKKELETFLAELRAQIKAAAIPVAPAVPALPAARYVRPIPVAPAIPVLPPPHYERPIPAAPAVPELREGELVPEVPTLTPEEEQATATSAADKEAFYLIGELKKATSDKEIDTLERQAAELRNLSSSSQAALKEAIQSSRNRLAQQATERKAKEAQELTLAQLRADANRVNALLSKLLKTPWNIELAENQWTSLVDDVRKQLAIAQELIQTLKENNLDTEADQLHDNHKRLFQRLNETLQDRKLWLEKKEQEQQALRLNKQAQELIAALGTTTDAQQLQNLIDKASKLTQERLLTPQMKTALNQAISQALTPSKHEVARAKEEAGRVRETEQAEKIQKETTAVAPTGRGTVVTPPPAPERAAPVTPTEKAAQELLQTLSKQADEKLIVQASNLLAQKGLREATAKALGKIVQDFNEKRKAQFEQDERQLKLAQANLENIQDPTAPDFTREMKSLEKVAQQVSVHAKEEPSAEYQRLIQEATLEQKVVDFALALADVRLATREDSLSKNLASVLLYLQGNTKIPWNTLNREDAQHLLEKLAQQKRNFEMLLELQLERLSFRGSTERQFVFAMRRAVDAIHKAIQQLQGAV